MLFVNFPTSVMASPDPRHLYYFSPQRGRAKVPHRVLFTINSEEYEVKILLLCPALASETWIMIMLTVVWKNTNGINPGSSGPTCQEMFH